MLHHHQLVVWLVFIHTLYMQCRRRVAWPARSERRLGAMAGTLECAPHSNRKSEYWIIYSVRCSIRSIRLVLNLNRNLICINWRIGRNLLIAMGKFRCSFRLGYRLLQLEFEMSLSHANFKLNNWRIDRQFRHSPPSNMEIKSAFDSYRFVWNSENNEFSWDTIYRNKVNRFGVRDAANTCMFNTWQSNIACIWQPATGERSWKVNLDSSAHKFSCETPLGTSLCARTRSPLSKTSPPAQFFAARMRVYNYAFQTAHSATSPERVRIADRSPVIYFIHKFCLALVVCCYRSRRRHKYPAILCISASSYPSGRHRYCLNGSLTALWLWSHRFNCRRSIVRDYRTMITRHWSDAYYCNTAKHTHQRTNGAWSDGSTHKLFQQILQLCLADNRYINGMQCNNNHQRTPDRCSVLQTSLVRNDAAENCPLLGSTTSSIDQ